MILANKCIFIVEDDVVNRLTYQIALLSAGAIIEFERQGADIEKRLQHKWHWDLIILDLMLPNGRSGYQLYEEIHQLAKLSNTPIVAVSAAESGEAMARCHELGFSGFIAKPIDAAKFPHQLLQIIKGEEIWSYS